MIFRSRPRLSALVLLVVPWLFCSAQSDPYIAPTHGVQYDTQTTAAFDHFYNMDYDRATREMEKIVEKHPDDPFAVNHLLTVVLMHDLYDTGAMNTGDYTNDS